MLESGGQFEDGTAAGGTADIPDHNHSVGGGTAMAPTDFTTFQREHCSFCYSVSVTAASWSVWSCHFCSRLVRRAAR